jgi:hypothetical protein
MGKFGIKTHTHTMLSFRRRQCDQGPQHHYHEVKCQAYNGLSCGAPATHATKARVSKPLNKGWMSFVATKRLKWTYLCDSHAVDHESATRLPYSDPKRRARIGKALVEKYREQNQADGCDGRVIITNIDLVSEAAQPAVGYYPVYPEWGLSKPPSDGFACAELSPQSLGPIEHGQPGLPPAKNLVNLWLGSACFATDLDDNGNPSDVFYSNRLAFYQDHEPYHSVCQQVDSLNPAFFVWVNPQGVETRLTPLEFRRIYCTIYEHLVLPHPRFAFISTLVAKHVNVQLCIYGAVPFGYDCDSAEDAYLDPNESFGYERILHTMLTLRQNPKAYPWRKSHKRGIW